MVMENSDLWEYISFAWFYNVTLISSEPHIAWEETDSFLTKDEAENDCCWLANIFEVSPRMPMLSQGEISAGLKKGVMSALTDKSKVLGS